MDRVTYSVVGLLLAFAQVGLGEELKKFPDFVEVCHKTGFEECIRKNIEAYGPLLAVGSEEFQVDCIEPFYMENFIVSEKSRSNGLQISASDVRVYNSTNYHVSRMRCQYPVSCKFDILFPNLYVNATYHVDGQIVALPIKGDGPMVASFDNVQTIDNVIALTPKMRNGVAYGKVKKLEVHTKFTGGHMRLDNLFNGDKLLGDAVNEAINANIVVLSEDIKPIVEKALNREFKKAVDKIVTQYTMEQLFPKD